jgi:hypothetical protein
MNPISSSDIIRTFVANRKLVVQRQTHGFEIKVNPDETGLTPGGTPPDRPSSARL